MRGWPDQWQRPDFMKTLLDDCVFKEYAIDRALFTSGWLEDREHFLQAAVRAAFDPDVAEPIMNELGMLVDAQRALFQTRALRYWSFKRPWKKIWLIMDSDKTPQDIKQKVRECQRLLNADVYGSQLLGVHPILLSQVREKTEDCVIGGSEYCSGAWKERDIVVETWCGHITCFACLRDYWAPHHVDVDAGDVPNPAAVGDWPCVMCRASPGRLRSKLEIAQTDLLGPEGDAAADENIIDLTHEPIPH